MSASAPNPAERNARSRRAARAKPPPPLSPDRLKGKRPSLVAVVDDEKDVHRAVRFVLETTDEFQVRGSYLNGTEALAGIQSAPPDVVLMDIRLPDISGIECTRQLTRALPKVQIVMMSALDDRRTMEAAIKAGCRSYLVKPFNCSQCLAALRCAVGPNASNTDWRQPDSSFCPLRGSSTNENCFQLTEREARALSALTEGRLYKQIAAELGVSLSLAHKLVHRAFGKLQVHNRLEAAEQWRMCSQCSRCVLPGKAPLPLTTPTRRAPE
jgi:DNA-binding NarL/FixJ family response regulator